MRQCWRPAVAALLVLAMGGCSVPVEQSARVQDDTGVPYDLLDEDAPPLVRPAPETTADVQLCFVAGRTIVRVIQPLEASADPLDVVRALAVPPADPAGLTTAVADDSLVSAVNVRGGIAHVDLASPAAAVGPDAQLLVVAQLVCTLTARPGVGQVAFLLDGAPVQVPAPDGSLTPGPVARDDYAGMIA
ncbi:MAG: GerMN domain-containing protein [Acidimicrobiales bacterium]